MFQVIEYKTKWTKTPGKPEALPIPTRKNVLAKFPTLEEARGFAEGRKKTIIQYPQKYMKEMNK